MFTKTKIALVVVLGLSEPLPQLWPTTSMRAQAQPRPRAKCTGIHCLGGGILRSKVAVVSPTPALPMVTSHRRPTSKSLPARKATTTRPPC